MTIQKQSNEPEIPEFDHEMRVRYSWASVSCQLRDLAGLNCNGFAKILEVSLPTVFRWEREKRLPQARQRYVLALLLGQTMPKPVTREAAGDNGTGACGYKVIATSEFVANEVAKAARQYKPGIAGDGVGRIVDKYRRARSEREKELDNVHRQRECDGPDEWKRLRDHVANQDWDVIKDFGEFILQHANLSPINIGRTYNYLGTAWLKTGEPAKALPYYYKGLDMVSDFELRLKLLANVTYAHLRLNELGEAREAVGLLLEQHGKNDIGLYNALCVGSAQMDFGYCDTYFTKLIDTYEDELRDRSSVLGRAIREDSDLSWFRAQPEFRKRLAELDGPKSNPRSGAGIPRGPIMSAGRASMIRQALFGLVFFAVSSLLGAAYIYDVYQQVSEFVRLPEEVAALSTTDSPSIPPIVVAENSVSLVYNASEQSIELAALSTTDRRIDVGGGSTKVEDEVLAALSTTDCTDPGETLT